MYQVELSLCMGDALLVVESATRFGALRVCVVARRFFVPFRLWRRHGFF